MKKRYLKSLYFLQCTDTPQKRMGGLFFTIMASILLLTGFSSSKAYAQNNGFTITEDFKGDNADGITLGANAYLTSGITDLANKLDDAEEEGWLRLTNAVRQQAGYAIINQSFPTDLGFLLDMEYATWGGETGADGFSFFLFDSEHAPTTGSLPFRIGAPGDALGYAHRFNLPGLAGGYLGVGIDEWGWFGSNYGDKNGKFPGLADNGRRPNSIAVRGSESSIRSQSYPFLGGTEDIPARLGIPGFSLDYKAPTQFRPEENIYYRRVLMEFVPVDVNGVTKYRVSTRIKADQNSPFQLIMDPILIDEAPPVDLNVGFASSTGTYTNIHEIRNVMVTTPTGIRVFKKVNKRRAYVGEEIEYTIGLYNHSEDALTNLKFSDLLSAGFEATSVVFNNFGNPLNTATGYSNTDLSDVTIGLAGYGEAEFIVKGNITGADPDGFLRNTANFDPNGQVYDPNLTNNISTVKTEVFDPKLLLEKSGTFIDVNNDNRVNVGDVIEYTFNVTNTGNRKLNNITVTDPLMTINGGPIDLEVGESDNTTFTGTYAITQEDIDNGGVYNQAEATGRDRLNRELTQTSVDPNPLDPTDPNYDPRRPDHTFVSLILNNIVITNPNIYQKVKGN